MIIVREHFAWAVLLFKASIDSYLIIMYSLLHGSLYQICISAFESVMNGSSFGEKYSIASMDRRNSYSGLTAILSFINCCLYGQ